MIGAPSALYTLPRLREFGETCLAILLADVPGASPGLTRWVTAAVMTPERRTWSLARDLGVRASTLNSRFRRAGLPSPRRYLSALRLVMLARYVEGRRISGPYAAEVAGLAHPQALSRFMRTATGSGYAAWRATASATAQFDAFRTTLWLPYRDVLATFDPCAPPRRARRRT